MNWKEICNKRKDTELMKEFANWLASLSAGSSYGWIREHLGDDNIKDIWGYLICFAETKGWYMKIIVYWVKGKIFINGGSLYRPNEEYKDNDCMKTPEQAMNWCASKFFEEAK